MTILSHPLRGRATSIQPHLPGATLESLRLIIFTIATTGYVPGAHDHDLPATNGYPIELLTTRL